MSRVLRGLTIGVSIVSALMGAIPTLGASPSAKATGTKQVEPVEASKQDKKPIRIGLITSL